MKLEHISMDDLPLWEAIECDPIMMEHLGGPAKKEDMPDRLRRSIESVKNGTAWIYKIIPNEDSEEAAGTISLWETEHDGKPTNEIGWMILPPFQKQGLGTRALGEILDRARASGRWGVVHAYPARSNAASNGLCKKLGFTLQGPREFEYRGTTLHCNDWWIDLGLKPSENEKSGAE